MSYDEFPEPAVFPDEEIITPSDIKQALEGSPSVFKIARRLGWNVCRLLRMKNGKVSEEDMAIIRFMLAKMRRT